jgi:hypothetical protein
MSKILMGPTGKLIEGHVLDSAKAPLERALKQYDPQLYLKWNPKKVYGWGCWELRMKPMCKSIVAVEKLGNASIVKIDYKELNVVNHVFDIPFLNYEVLKRVKQADTWTASIKGKNFGRDLEYKEAKIFEKEDERANRERDYMAKQHKREINELKEYILSGHNPYRLADYWRK